MAYSSLLIAKLLSLYTQKQKEQSKNFALCTLKNNACLF
ncbi:hypothetical protein PPRY_a1601 [Pseudoalteromonas prydzensis ACAM 620]|nr:hypothetical protein [Pseudoalteromonas prydzensis ACAM 620]